MIHDNPLRRSRSTTRKRSLLASLTAVAVIAGVVGGTTSTGAAESPVDPSQLPLATIGDAEYVGGFALPEGRFGDSDLNFSEGPIEVHDGSLYIVGHAHQQAIAEFAIPSLTKTTDIAQLEYAPVLQPFASVLDRATGGNNQSIDRIAGMDMIDGQLVVNAYEYYDAPADNVDTTIVLRDPDNLADSPVVGYHRIEGRVRAAGWMTELPGIGAQTFGATHLTGHSSGMPINSR